MAKNPTEKAIQLLRNHGDDDSMDTSVTQVQNNDTVESDANPFMSPPHRYLSYSVIYLFNL